ncbi:MAG: dTDP-4-dehydrorhamnose 3,5-epimerase [Saprospiraceae bacterium]|nr:dTDP-4-dehydrorhamnose 3,5-epimerase [Saprospiraceae bacterium]
MSWEKTEFEGLWVFQPKVFGDERGYFFESYNQKNAPEEIKNIQFVQDNEAKSSFGVLRGLHYQLPPFSQSKLVRVVVGEVLDVVVDIRPNSATYGKSFSFLLTENLKNQMFVPKGFAHGYVVLSETAVFAYKCDDYYTPEAEAGLRYDDKLLLIDWTIPSEKMILSDRDKCWPDFKDHKPFQRD